MDVVDAQVHIWPADSPERPWPAYGRGHAHGEALSATDMLALMDTAGVDRAILVPPSWEGDRNDYCLQAAADHPARFAVMGRLALQPQPPPAVLEHWRDTPGMLGVRLTFHRDFQRAWLSDGSVDWFWAQAQRFDLPVMVYVPGSIGEFAAVAERFPGCRFVLDHLALRGVFDSGLPEQLAPVLELARFPNVAVKASCLPNFVSEDYPFPTLQHALRLVVDAFGPRRTFWGSDVSRLRCSLAECLALVTDACDFLSDEEKSWILGRGITDWLAKSW